MKCVIAVNLAEMSSEGGALASASVPSISAGTRLRVILLHQFLASSMWKGLPGSEGCLRITHTWKPCRKSLYCSGDGRRALKMSLGAVNLLRFAVVVQHCVGLGLPWICVVGKILADAKVSLLTADDVSQAEATCVSGEMRLWIRGKLWRPILQLFERICL